MVTWLVRALKYLPLVIQAGKALYDLVQGYEKMKEAKVAVKQASAGDFQPLKDIIAALEEKKKNAA